MRLLEVDNVDQARTTARAAAVSSAHDREVRRDDDHDRHHRERKEGRARADSHEDVFRLDASRVPATQLAITERSEADLQTLGLFRRAKLVALCPRQGK